MPHVDRSPLRIEPIARERWDNAAEILWPELAQPERLRRVAALRATGTDWPAEIWGAFRGDEPVAVIRVQVQPGRTATIAPPRGIRAEPGETCKALLDFLIDELTTRRVRVAQALVDMRSRSNDEASADSELLCQAGFKCAGELAYLMCPLSQPSQTTPASAVELVRYSETLAERFAGVVQRTYEGSLDCPAADGLRTIDDVLAGYGGVLPRHSQRDWFIARANDADVGCLILSDQPQSDQIELTYLGVVPEARGRGLGLCLVRHAQQAAQRAGRARLVLAVDSGNVPALAIYEQAGFIRWNTHGMFLRAL